MFFGVFFVFVLCLVDPMLPVSQDCPFFIIPSQLYLQCYRPYNKLILFNFNVTLVLYYMCASCTFHEKAYCSVLCVCEGFLLCALVLLWVYFFFFKWFILFVLLFLFVFVLCLVPNGTCVSELSILFSLCNLLTPSPQDKKK